MLFQYLENLDEMSERNDVHEKLLDFYKTFLVVGGMPEAVADFCEKESLVSCQQVHRDILFSMMDDFEKYNDDVPADILRRVFEYAIHNICNQTKSSSAIQGISAYYFEESLKILRRAGLVFPVKASSCEVLPLGAGEKETQKKLLVFDTGIYLTECKLDIRNVLAAKIFDEMNKGDVVEMQTGLEMLKYCNAYAEMEGVIAYEKNFS